MKNWPRFSLFFLLLYLNISNAEECLPPKQPICLQYPLQSIHTIIKVNFLNKTPSQVVYLDGGCSFGVHKFLPIDQLNNTFDKYSNPFSLRFIFCVGNRLINSLEFKIDSRAIVACDVGDHMVCHKSS